jgi:hypothetical protein
MTRSTLIESLPRKVTGIDTFCAYQSMDDLQADVQLSPLHDVDHNPGLVATSIAWDFAVPKQLQTAPPHLKAELEVLAEAVKLSGSKDYRDNRRAYWQWVQNLTAGTDTITGQDDVDEAVEKLGELVAKQRELVRAVWRDRAVRIGFLLGTVTLGLVAEPLAPVSVAGAAMAVGQFTWSELRAPSQIATDNESRVAGMFCLIDDRIRKQYFGDVAD